MNKVKAISLVQIISALLIVNHHTAEFAIPILKNFTKFGFVANTVFVFLSGFLLSISFSKRDDSPIGEFFYRRINRIYPSLHVALLISAILYLLANQAFTFKSVLYSASGISYFFLGNSMFGGRHLWFVSVILVCYVLFIPTYRIVKRYPFQLISGAFGIFILLAFLIHGSLDGIYNKVSSEIIFRFLYHYIVFSFAIYQGQQNNDFKFLRGKKYIGLFFVFMLLYFLIHTNTQLGLVAICSAFIVAISLIAIGLMVYPSIEKYISPIMILSPVTYELYLIHVPIIDILDDHFHGKFISYPIAFISSILFAFLVSMLAKQYTKLTKRCTGWLLRGEKA